MRDEIGDRMKKQYEDRTRFYLPRRTYTIMRIDGRAFHTYTRGMQKPFDMRLVDAMDYTMQYLAKEVQGTVFGYTQSDEFSLLLVDFAKDKTEAWFDGNIQKMVSVAASVATMEFNRVMYDTAGYPRLGNFDCRVFTIPDRVEVENYFIWRQKDAKRNGITNIAQSHFSHRELHGKSTHDKVEMLKEKGVDPYVEKNIYGIVGYKDFYENFLTTSAPDFLEDREESLSKYIPKMR